MKIYSGPKCEVCLYSKCFVVPGDVQADLTLRCLRLFIQKSAGQNRRGEKMKWMNAGNSYIMNCIPIIIHICCKEFCSQQPMIMKRSHPNCLLWIKIEFCLQILGRVWISKVIAH
jgi:hypothetical protein